MRGMMSPQSVMMTSIRRSVWIPSQGFNQIKHNVDSFWFSKRGKKVDWREQEVGQKGYLSGDDDAYVGRTVNFKVVTLIYCGSFSSQDTFGGQKKSDGRTRSLNQKSGYSPLKYQEKSCLYPKKKLPIAHTQIRDFFFLLPFDTMISSSSFWLFFDLLLMP